ncbi:MAG TPA: S41 family peptidase [Bacteroidales bacterium]|jgi:carboxyl-terminal processing protease|nr:S41 family peptidase [Bacteroidales bacterium]HQH23154.1 S41 family peptidase [Bacteroidales bacterium]HQJ80988.1 S41 family peptidase [Bacteroidales bacterium]
MKKKISARVAVAISALILGGAGLGFLGIQETRDFRIAKNLDIFLSLFRELNTFYVDEINPDKIIKTGIDNMLKTLDPYTVYYPESEADDFTFMTTGKYGGIGSLVRGGNEYVVISQVYKGFPADMAGIRAGDIIKKVDGVSIRGMSTDKVSDRLKGNPGSEVVVTIERNGRESDHSMKRERIVIPPVPWYGMIDDKTAYIRFTNFTQNCIADVRNALTELRKSGPEQLILDLRSNPGGLLSEAVEIVNLFVGPGNDVVSTKGKVRQFDDNFRTTKPAADETIPLAVLINRSSASAAEIVAGAIQDLDRGVIVGQRSYGKGLVQVTRPLSYNSQLKVTTAKYYIPSGRCIQALDFSHPDEDGSVGFIPDSLITEFKTRNGRTVKDGGGISPDVAITPEMLSQMSTELYLRNFIFDFATRYYWANPGIKNISDFKFTDKDFEDFGNFLKERRFQYKTITETSLNELIANAKKEKYYELHKDLFSELEKDIAHDLDQDLAIFRDEITQLLEEEIIGRYFYEEGTIIWSVKRDVQIQKALEILNDRAAYGSILSGKSLPVLRANEPPASYVRSPGQLSAERPALQHSTFHV